MSTIVANLNAQNACPPGALSTQPVDYSGLTPPFFYGSGDGLALTALLAPYSMTQELTLTLHAGSEITLTTDSSTLSAPAPRLSSLPILGWALVVGLGWFSRHRRTAKSETF